jgi:predicted CXXCH cytochrome family protein
MHGPVVAAACLWCHAPHESAFSALLKDEPRNVCIGCHDQGLLGTERVPAHADESRSCLDCHYGHGGTRQYFIRDEVIKSSGSPGEAPSP